MVPFFLRDVYNAPDADLSDVNALTWRRCRRRRCHCCAVGYDDSVNPAISNGFATGAMRFGHTQIQGVIQGRDAAYRVIRNITLSTVICSILCLSPPDLIDGAGRKGLLRNDLFVLSWLSYSG